MRPLLQHASRTLTVATKPSRIVCVEFGRLGAGGSPCLPHQDRAASTFVWNNHSTQSYPRIAKRWPLRQFSTSIRRVEEGKPSNPSKPIPTHSPTTSRVEGRAPEFVSSIEDQKRLQEASEAPIDKQHNEDQRAPPSETAPGQLSTLEAQERLQEDEASTAKQNHVMDNISRVPDEHLPSHRERQRWDFSKRFSELMDELLPKLAVVTQKVNTYTGTDYSGVEALRQEIKEQESLVKARRAAIDTAKQSLDTAHAQQASAQKEVVALLERKHSWSAGDLERYMSLIRSEHINDQAIRVAKESVVSAEAALEEARTQLEKRERAQYHEEQIWSDTIRRNSTWVTFGLMGVNIFLLLLSLAILEPWRRRRMVREIKSALEAQKAAAPATLLPSIAPSTTQEELAAIEEEIDRANDAADADVEPANSMHHVTAHEPFVATSAKGVSTDIGQRAAEMLESAVDPVVGIASPSPGFQASPKAESRPHVHSETANRLDTWQGKVSAIAHDVVSDRIISMRRIDYTTAILQGAAAGAVITAALVGMFRPS
ncbi:Mdm33 family-domain-containing protein [Phaeosphaeria sp. MPI-PUGE-AT-0046c]|nr:Mdm33 family-domain-containing protein [Phaeosphaeria sp. MPI-PUGE-AT-0046c]